MILPSLDYQSTVILNQCQIINSRLFIWPICWRLLPWRGSSSWPLPSVILVAQPRNPMWPGAWGARPSPRLFEVRPTVWGFCRRWRYINSLPIFVRVAWSFWVGFPCISGGLKFLRGWPGRPWLCLSCRGNTYSTRWQWSTSTWWPWFLASLAWIQTLSGAFPGWHLPHSRIVPCRPAVDPYIIIINRPVEINNQFLSCFQGKLLTVISLSNW